MNFIVAHQGGWDEMLLVAAPVAIFVGLLAMANRRAERMQRDRATTVGSGDHAVGGSEPGENP